MAYTQSDLESVEATIGALAASRREIDVVINGVGVQYGRLGLVYSFIGHRLRSKKDEGGVQP